MLKYLFPKIHLQYSSLPILGPICDQFAEFLNKLGYKDYTIRCHLHAILAIDHCLKQSGCQTIKTLTRAELGSCAHPCGHLKDADVVAATTKLLERFFDEQKIFLPPELAPANLLERQLFGYCDYLKKNRGSALSTVERYSREVFKFLIYLEKNNKLSDLHQLIPKDIEDFVRDVSDGMKQRTLKMVLDCLRSFLRFLIANGEISTGLDHIDMPCIYRDEQLPHTLSWDIIQALLQSIDRSTAIGKRDYAILLLITTYGLRSSEVVSLKLDDINWGTDCLQIFQHKMPNALILPLTNAVGESIFDYLLNGRPSVSYREVFVQHQAPLGILTSKAIGSIFERCRQRSGLPIPFHGAHCLRHSYAVHLLRQGVSLKTIADILGHKSLASTCIYLRLNVEDLRTVPLSFPASFVNKNEASS